MRLLTEDFHVRRNIHEFGGGEPLDGRYRPWILRNTTGSFSPFTGVTTSDARTVRVGFGVDCEHELLLLIRPYSSGGSLGRAR
jgi:hypothetical protein